MLQLAGPVKVPICRNYYSEIKKRAENPVNGNHALPFIAIIGAGCRPSIPSEV
jgi:hypothetical protein